MIIKKKVLKKILSLLLILVMIISPFVNMKGAKGAETTERKDTTETVTFEPSENASKKALDWLNTNQNEDGSWGSADLSIMETSQVLDYISKNNVLTDNRQKSIIWIENTKILNNDEASRVLPFISDTEKYNSIKDVILSSQNEDGGWGVAKGYESDLLDTVLCLKSLITSEDIEISVLQKAVSYIISNQNPNGSWSLSDKEELTVSLTAQITIILNTFQTETNLTSSELQTSMKKAGEFLVSVQRNDKTWGTEEDSITDTLLSYSAVLNTVGIDAVDTVVSAILNVQSNNGSWYDSPYITALAVKSINDCSNMPSANINSIKLYKNVNGIRTESYSFNSYETFEIQADTAYSNIDVTLLYYVKQNDGSVTQIETKEIPVWDTQNKLPGTYSVLVTARDNKTGNILASYEKEFDIVPTRKVLNVSVNLDVDATKVGKEVTVNAKASIVNASNIDKQLKLRTVVLDGDQEVFCSEEVIDVNVEEQTKKFDVLTFLPNADVVKDYIVLTEVFDGEEKLVDGQSVFRVLALPPETRVDAIQNLDREILYPNKDNIVATIKLKGEGVLMPIDEDSSQITPTPQATGGYANGKMYNDYIEYTVNSNGRFTVGTTGGDPDKLTDNNKILLYGHSSSNTTSYTTIKMDGTNYFYIPSTQNPTPNTSDLSNTSEYTINNVSIKQIVSIVPNTSTDRSDVVQVKYVVRNNDTANHDIGLRIMLDTMLGSNDAAPFRIPGFGALTTEMELTGDQIPEYWQAFDSLTNPTVISQGTLWRDKEIKPDKVQFTNWRKANNNMWLDSVNTGVSNGDSAVSMYWNPDILVPGETKEFVTYYGLSDFKQDLTTPLAVNLTGATKIIIEKQNYSPNPFTVTSYITNVSSSTTNNVKVRIVLPDGLKLADDQQEYINIASLKSGQEQQVSWNVEIEPSAVERNLVYSVMVSADGVNEKTLSRNLNIPALYDDTSGKNVVFETYIPQGNMQIDTSKLLPEPIEIIDNDDGGKTLRWKFDKIAIGEEKLLSISYDGTDLVSDSEVLLTKNTKLTYQDRNDTILTENLPDLKIPVSKYMLDSKVITDKTSYTAKENVVITNTVKNLTNYPATLTGKVEITDINGNVVKTITETNSWEANESKTIDFSWNTGTTMTGTYKAVVTWCEGEKVISIAECTFDIISDAEIVGTVTVDKQLYAADEIVNICNVIKNNSTNNKQNDLTVKTNIKDSLGTIIWSSEDDVLELLPAKQISVNNIWNAAKNVPGQYLITMEVYHKEIKLAESSTNFEIVSKTEGIQGISGSLEVMQKNIYSKDDVNFKYTINNTGNVKLENITARIRIVDIATGSAIGTITDITSIDISSSDTREKVWSHEPLNAGNYMVILDAVMPDGREVALGSGYFTVEKPKILESEAFQYALFSGSTVDALCMYLYNATINGNIRTNKGFEFSSTSLTVSGLLSSFEAINTWGQTIQIGQKETNPVVIEIPDVVNEIKQIASADGNNRSNSLMISDYGNGIELSKSEISEDSIQINGTRLDSKGYIVANNNVSFNLNSMKSTSEEGIVICSSNGDISFNLTSADLKGIIYAPNGTVYINVSSFKLTGRIIAKRIIVNCSDFDVTSTEQDLNLIDTTINR